MKLLVRLSEKWQNTNHPFLIYGENKLWFSDIENQQTVDLSAIKSGDVVALIGDFDPNSILTLLKLIGKGTIVVPLTAETKNQHQYFFETAFVDFVIENDTIKRKKHTASHPALDVLRQQNHPGLVLFSTGTTGRPKAILHDLSLFLERYETPRPTLKTVNFLLFDHIGGINTLLHTLFNKGIIVAPTSRTVEDILELCNAHEIEVLPTTPTFLRMMLMSGLVPNKVPNSLKIITYGTERMDQMTLTELCNLLPNVDFRQTFGMSELGIVRAKSRSRDSLYMKIGGEGVETRIVNDVLEIRSKTRMLGYLNAPSPFDADGWYNTKDIVEEEEGFYKIVGRTSETINVGGLKFMPSEVERVALQYVGVKLAKAFSQNNPITGQHVEIIVQENANCTIDKTDFINFLKSQLQTHMVPKRVKIGTVAVGHRFKQS